MNLTNQIIKEIQDLSLEIDKIQFGEVLIEIKHNSASLITYKGSKKPTNAGNNQVLPLTRESEFDKLDLEAVIKK